MKLIYLAALACMTLFILFTAGYATEKYDLHFRDPRCINSACTPSPECRTTPRFTRHAGPCK